MHKAWLERRAMFKAQDGAQNNTRKLYYFNKILSNPKLNSSQTSPNPFQRKHKKFRVQQNEVIIDNDSSADNFTTIAQPSITNPSDYTTIYPITTSIQLTSPVTKSPDLALVTQPSTFNGTKNNNLMPKKDKSIKPRRKLIIWGAWHPWSECSRTCGGGVMSQRRDCIR